MTAKRIERAICASSTSPEDYLYPSEYFVKLPASVSQELLSSSRRDLGSSTQTSRRAAGVRLRASRSQIRAAAPANHFAVTRPSAPIAFHTERRSDPTADRCRPLGSRAPPLLNATLLNASAARERRSAARGT